MLLTRTIRFCNNCLAAYMENRYNECIDCIGTVCPRLEAGAIIRKGGFMKAAGAASSWFPASLFGCCLGFALCLSVASSFAQEEKKAEDTKPAAEAAPSPGAPAVADDLALEQERLASKYARLEELLLKMSSLEQAQNPRRAALLLRAIEQSKEKLTKTQLES